MRSPQASTPEVADNYALRQPGRYCAVLQQFRVLRVVDILYYPSNAVRKLDGGLVIDMFRTAPIVSPYVTRTALDTAGVVTSIRPGH
jgi:hypothetical protein